MRSEIPQLEVVTAIADADFEDFVAQLLFSQGWSIIYRAFDAPALTSFLSKRQSQRTVIIYMTDLPSLTSASLMAYEDEPFTFISLDGTEAVAHAVMQKIRSFLRLPLVQSSPMPLSPQVDRPRSIPKVIAITGSGGAPGKTSLALALGRELALLHRGKVALLDLDFKERRLTGRFNSSITDSSTYLIPCEPSSKPNVLPTLTEGEVTVIDLGSLPALGEVVHDRRWYGNLLSSTLEMTSELLYLLSSTQESLDDLALFLKEFPLLLRKIQVTYICVLTGSSRELREAQARFLTLTTAENRFLIRQSQLLAGAQGRIRAHKPGRGEIGKIAQSLL